MATKKQILDALVRPVVEGLGYECWGIEYISQGKHSVLRVYIERPVVSQSEIEGDERDGPERESGIELSDCEKVSRQLSGVLDVEDPIAGDYTLEVSSPGMDRPLYELEHFKRFAGHQVAIRLRMPFEGRRKFNGLLVGVEGHDVVLRMDQEEYLLPMEGIEKANVVPQFD